MKKTLLILLAVCLLAVSGLLYFVNRYAAERFDFRVGEQSVGYSVEKLHFYNSLQEEYDATASILKTKTNVAAAGQDAVVSFTAAHKPLRLYELNPGDEKNERLKISFNRETNRYELSPMYDAESCEYSVVADYGFTKNVYTFCVFNQTHIENHAGMRGEDPLPVSAFSSEHQSGDVTVAAENLCRPDYLYFTAEFANHTPDAAECTFFGLEKQVDGKWYTVPENDVTYNQKFWDDYKSHFPLTIAANGSVRHKFPAALDALFHLQAGNGIESGVYRIVLPYTAGGKETAAVSDPFFIGFVPAEKQAPEPARNAE